MTRQPQVSAGEAPEWIFDGSDERDLVARAKKGDAQALQRIARSELPRVHRLLFKLVGPRHDLDDLTQLVFLELCRALPGFRGESRISTFVGGITVRVARRALRPSAWWKRRAELSEEPESPDANPEAKLEAIEGLQRVQKALEKVAPKKRIAFLLWAVEGLTVEEIAATTGYSVSATRSQIYYAQKELHAKVAKDPVLKELLGGGFGTPE